MLNYKSLRREWLKIRWSSRLGHLISYRSFWTSSGRTTGGSSPRKPNRSRSLWVNAKPLFQSELWMTSTPCSDIRRGFRSCSGLGVFSWGLRILVETNAQSGVTRLISRTFVRSRTFIFCLRILRMLPKSSDFRILGLITVSLWLWPETWAPDEWAPSTKHNIYPYLIRRP